MEYGARALRTAHSREARDFVRLAAWAEARGLVFEAWRNLQRALDLDPRNAAAQSIASRLLAGELPAAPENAPGEAPPPPTLDPTHIRQLVDAQMVERVKLENSGNGVWDRRPAGCARTTGCRVGVSNRLVTPQMLEH